MTTLTVDASSVADDRIPEGLQLLVTGPSVRDVDGKQLRTGGVQRFPMKAGTLSIELLATDTPNTDPLPDTWGYTFELQWDGGGLPAFDAPLPSTPATVDLATIQPMDPADPLYLGSKGDKGDTGDTGPQGPQGVPGTVTDASVAAQVTSGTATGVAVAAKIRSVGDLAYEPRKSLRVSDLARPIILPHRGAGASLAPGDTLEAMRIGAQFDYGIIDGGDWSATSDGSIVCSHDTTLDAATTMTGNVSNYSSMALYNAVVDASVWFGGTFKDTKLPTAEQIFGELGGSTILCPEPKDAGSVAFLVNLIQRLGLQKSTIPNSFTEAWLLPFVAIGCTDVLLNITTMPDQTSMNRYKAEGIHWLGITVPGGTITPTNVDTLIANGFEVMVGTINRKSDATPYLGHGVSMWCSDDPLYFAHALSSANATKYRRTTDPFIGNTYYHGHMSSAGGDDASPAARGTFVAGRWVMPATAYYYNLQGWACPLVNAATSYNINYSLTLDTPGADPTRWNGCWFCASDDAQYKDIGASTENGYQFWFRANGGLNIARKVAGVAGTTVTASSTALSAPLVTTAPLASGVAITALPVTAIATAIAVGAKFTLPTGQVATVGTAATVGATSIAIASLTPSAVVPSASSIPQTATLRIAVTPTQIVVTRTDVTPNVSVTLVDTTSRGAYFHFAQQASGSGLVTSISNVTIT